MYLFLKKKAFMLVKFRKRIGNWLLSLKNRNSRIALDLEESWEKSLAETGKEKLEQLVKSITPPKPGEVNFMGIQAQIDENGATAYNPSDPKW